MSGCTGEVFVASAPESGGVACGGEGSSCLNSAGDAFAANNGLVAEVVNSNWFSFASRKDCPSQKGERAAEIAG